MDAYVIVFSLQWNLNYTAREIKFHCGVFFVDVCWICNWFISNILLQQGHEGVLIVRFYDFLVSIWYAISTQWKESKELEGYKTKKIRKNTLSDLNVQFRSGQ